MWIYLQEKSKKLQEITGNKSKAIFANSFEPKKTNFEL